MGDSGEEQRRFLGLPVGGMGANRPAGNRPAGNRLAGNRPPGGERGGGGDRGEPEGRWRPLVEDTEPRMLGLPRRWFRPAEPFDTAWIGRWRERWRRAWSGRGRGGGREQVQQEHGSRARRRLPRADRPRPPAGE